MTFDEFISGKGCAAVIKFDIAAHNKYPNVRSSQVIDFDDEKIIGRVETKDGKVHRMTVRNWYKKKKI